MAESHLAMIMLRMWLGEVEPDHARIAHFTRLLVENRSPNADVVLSGLRRLDGYWTAEQIGTSASLAAEAGRDHLAVRCIDCLKEIGDRYQADALLVRDAAIHAALPALDELAVLVN